MWSDFQAGIAVVTSSVFKADFVENCQMNAAGQNVDRILVSGSISGSVIPSYRVQNSFNNTTELNSSIYFLEIIIVNCFIVLTC